MAIVAILEFGHGGTNFFEVLEDATMEHLFLERPVEPFGNTIGLRFGNEGKAWRDAPELDLIEEVPSLRQSRHMPARNRQLTAAPSVSHTPRKAHWISYPLWDYAQTTKNNQLQDTVRRLVKEAYGEKALNCSPAADQTGFLPSCLFRFWLVAKVLPPNDARELINQSLQSQDLPVPILNPKTPHENGLNFSRAWALWDIYWLTMRPEIIDAYAGHVRVGINERSQWAGSYETVGHWVPQFGMFALQPLFGSAKK